MQVYIVTQNRTSPGAICRGIYAKKEDAVACAKELICEHPDATWKNNSTSFYNHWGLMENETDRILEEIMVLEKDVRHQHFPGMSIWPN